MLVPVSFTTVFMPISTLGLTQGSDVINILFANATHVYITMGWNPRVITLTHV